MMSNSNDPVTQVREGMDVYGSDGEKIGEVGDVHIGILGEGQVTGTTESDERSYFQIKQGGVLGIGGSEVYVPAELVQQVSDDRVTLNRTSDELSSGAYSEVPTAPQPGGGAGNDDNTGTAGVLGLGRTTNTPNTPGGTGYGNTL